MLTPQGPKPLGKWERRAVVAFAVSLVAIVLPLILTIWVLTYRFLFRLPL